jgi:hypothetical protein
MKVDRGISGGYDSFESDRNAIARFNGWPQHVCPRREDDALHPDVGSGVEFAITSWQHELFSHWVLE